MHCAMLNVIIPFWLRYDIYATLPDFFGINCLQLWNGGDIENRIVVIGH